MASQKACACVAISTNERHVVPLPTALHVHGDGVGVGGGGVGPSFVQQVIWQPLGVSVIDTGRYPRPPQNA